MIDFDIDVIDRSQCPGAPGARPGGMPVDMFFAAARYLAAEPRVKLVDLTAFDPSLDLGDITALTARRWACAVLAGYAARAAGRCCTLPIPALSKISPRLCAASPLRATTPDRKSVE